MADLEDLERLMSDLESDRVERKESISDTDRIRQAICAFANDLPGYRLPGYLFIGVDDTGRPTSNPITDQLLQTLADMRSDGNILPIPSMVVRKETLRGSPVVVVEVHPSDTPPVRFKGQVWIRVGPRRAIATLWVSYASSTSFIVAGIGGGAHSALPLSSASMIILSSQTICHAIS